MHQPTQGAYKNWINLQDGVLAAHTSYSPAYMTSNQSGAPLPALRQWSDIAFLSLLHQSQREGRALAAPAYVFRMSISNSQTLRVLETIWDMLPVDARPDGPFGFPWPGQEFDVSSDTGRVLLATPNGAGVAWLLINHKLALGHLEVVRVRIFAGNTGPHMLFYLGAVG